MQVEGVFPYYHTIGIWCDSVRNKDGLLRRSCYFFVFWLLWDKADNQPVFFRIYTLKKFPSQFYFYNKLLQKLNSMAFLFMLHPLWNRIWSFSFIYLIISGRNDYFMARAMKPTHVCQQYSFLLIMNWLVSTCQL